MHCSVRRSAVSLVFVIVTVILKFLKYSIKAKRLFTSAALGSCICCPVEKKIGFRRKGNKCLYVKTTHVLIPVV